MNTDSRVGLPALFLALLSSLFVVACSEERPALVFGGDVAADWEKAYNSGDAEGIAALLTDDAVVMPPNAPMVEGRSAIKAYYRNHFESRVVPAKMDERELTVFGAMTYRHGVYALQMPDGHTEYGKFMEIWKNDNGQWRLHRSIWNSNEPAGMPPHTEQASAGHEPSSSGM